VQALSRIGAVQAGETHAFVEARGKELTVSTVRNPLDLLVSWFVLNPSWKNFEKFLMEYKHSDMVKGGELHYFAEKSDVLLDYEYLQTDLDALLSHLGLPPVRILTVNVTPEKQPFKTYYNATTLDIANHIYKKDMALYEQLKTARNQ
jgi:hypothetical protein